MEKPRYKNWIPFKLVAAVLLGALALLLIARLLVEKAAEYCRKQGIQSLAVTGSDADIELYRALGFKTRLGTDLAMLLPYES